MKILARMPNWIGDAVMAIATVHEIKKRHPDAIIDIIAKPHILELFLHDPAIRNKIVFQKKTSREQSATIKQQSYTHSLLLTNSFSSAWQFFRWGLNNRIGYGNEGRGFLLHHSRKLPRDLEATHLVEVYKGLLPFLDATNQKISPMLYLVQSEKEEIKNKLKEIGVDPSKPILGINPGAAYGLAKCWMPDRFHLVVKMLWEAHPHLQIIVFGDKSMQELGATIVSGIQGRVFNLTGKTSMRQLMAAISFCSVFLTNDSGPMHIASAFSIPTVALFGSTNPLKTGPYSNGMVIQKKVKCSPCYLKTCPIDFKCMKQISVEDVLNVIKKVIK